jgi:hypothetical protein
MTFPFPFPPIPQSLTEVEALAWDLLQTGVADRNRLAHTPSLVTLDQNGLPQARVVVLRQACAQNRQLRIHTDYRCAKVREVQRNPSSLFLFYEPDIKTQLRIRTHAAVHYQDPTAQQAWDETRLFSRRCYLANQASGTISPTPTTGMPAGWEKRNPNEAESAAGWPNFAVILAEMLEIDWLYLAAEGHLRAKLVWDAGKGCWDGHWLAP